METNIIYSQERIIAHHTYDKDEGWKIKLDKELNDEEKEAYKEIIKKMAKRNQIDVTFENEK